MRFKAFHTLQFHSCCIAAQSTQWFLERHLCSFWRRAVTLTICYFVWFEKSFVPWGQSRWKREQNLKHLIKKAHPDAYLQQIQQMLRPSHLAALFAAASSLTRPSGNVKGPVFLFLCSLTSWAEVWLRVIKGWFCVLHPLSVSCYCL